MRLDYGECYWSLGREKMSELRMELSNLSYEVLRHCFTIHVALSNEINKYSGEIYSGMSSEIYR